MYLAYFPITLYCMFDVTPNYLVDFHSFACSIIQHANMFTPCMIDLNAFA